LQTQKHVNKESQQGGDAAQESEEIPPAFYGYVARRASQSQSVEQTSLLHTAMIPQIEMPSTLPYNLFSGTKKASYSQWSQDIILAPILDQIKQGFFVESGARDGESHSNSLLYELKGWSGLLVEPSQIEYPKIKDKHRKAYSFNGCLSPTSKPEKLHFADSGNGLSHFDSSSGFVSEAYPLLNLLEAVNRTTVDFWSLDIEGAEGKVLKATDFSKIEVGVFLIEMAMAPALTKEKHAKNDAQIKAVMSANGFKDIGMTTYVGGQLDRVFVNPSYFKARGLKVPTTLH
jgi:hypothetical protein